MLEINAFGNTVTTRIIDEYDGEVLSEAEYTSNRGFLYLCLNGVLVKARDNEGNLIEIGDRPMASVVRELFDF